MVKSPTMLRTGMPFLSAGAAAWLAKSMAPSNARLAWASVGMIKASNSRSAWGALGRKSTGLMPLPLMCKLPMILLRLFSKGLSWVVAIKLTLPPCKLALRVSCCRLPPKSMMPSTGIFSTSPPPVICPVRAKGETVLSVSLP